ncbi:MAG TPA: right-handed parallel beta-helix repeat-containing protein, partial [Candidatus Eisenbacteria bacterium]|nr:right-handed parallel beta-helix repeat-containing protein [Candidatus Eisenbacteria bacterium]
MNYGISARSTADGLKVLNSRIENTATNPAGTPGWHLAGIFCHGTPRPQIANNVIRGWAQAIGVWWGVSNALVEGNQILDNYGFADAAHTIPRSAIEDYGAEVGNFNNRFVGNTVVGSTAMCFEIATGVIGSVYQGNRTELPGSISDYGDHFSVNGSISQPTADIVIEGNRCVSTGERADSGVKISGKVDRTEIRENSFTGFTCPYLQGTVFIGGGDGVGTVLVENNTFTDGAFAIRVYSAEKGGVIRRNAIRNATRHAILIESGDGYLVQENDIGGSSGARGVTLAGGKGHQVIGNRIGVGFMGVLCMTEDNSIIGNTVEETAPSYAGTVRLYGPNARRNDVRLNSITAAPDSRALLI